MSTITDYFATLRDWKLLLAYKAETRVDSIVGFALPQVFSHVRDLDVSAVIPELPLRIGSVQPKHADAKFANKSYKVDFFVVTKCGKNLLVEFKTNSASRRDGQDGYLKDAQHEGLGAVVSGVIALLGVTTYKAKYLHLIRKLCDAGLVEEVGGEFRTSVQNDQLEIVYVQPHLKEGDVASQVIDFLAVAEAIEHGFKDDEFMHEAAESFRSWSED
ncbi:hypothetical protein QUF76_14655 [Desulfobacterales bacterium HSG16]|nr:hypothetical protein [Desulfobacterales bacterium HSG16]